MQTHAELLPFDAFSQRASDVFVATADEPGDAAEPIREVLQMLRVQLGMDVAFVSEFTDGQRVFRHVDQRLGRPVLGPGISGPLETSWCQRVADGRLPEYVRDTRKRQDAGLLPAAPVPIGTYLSTPIVLADGSVYGTLCCFCFRVNDEAGECALRQLRYTARLVARKLDQQAVMDGLAARAIAGTAAGRRSGASR